MDAFELFTRYSTHVQAELASDAPNPWEASPFAWIVKEPSARRGAVGQRLLELWLIDSGFEVGPRTNRGHDLRVEGVPVEVKFSSLWASGIFKFQQLRDQDYDAALLLGLEPQRVRLWVTPKDLLLEHVLGNADAGQHTGRDASDTFWISFIASNPPDWLQPYGDTLDVAREHLRQLCH